MDNAIDIFISPIALADNSTEDNELISRGGMTGTLRRALNAQITLLNTG
jgi:hypothetical protein